MRRSATLALATALVAGLGAVTAPAQAKPQGETIVDTAVAVNAATGEFDYLIEAVTRAELAGALDGRRQFTVFAPTDAAFEELFAVLGVSGVEEIPLDTLTAVLLYHVAPGQRFSDAVLDSSRIRTLNGDFAEPSLVGGVPYIDNAQIIVADVDASNGVIHVIDSVLLPD